MDPGEAHSGQQEQELRELQQRTTSRAAFLIMGLRAQSIPWSGASRLLPQCLCHHEVWAVHVDLTVQRHSSPRRA